MTSFFSSTDSLTTTLRGAKRAAQQKYAAELKAAEDISKQVRDLHQLDPYANRSSRRCDRQQNIYLGLGLELEIGLEIGIG